MTKLGVIPIRDQQAVTDVRVKILGLLRALGADEVRATRTAVAVSELAHRFVSAGESAQCRVDVEQDESGTRLRLSIAGAHVAPNGAGLEVFFDSLRPLGARETGIVGELTLAQAPRLTERVLRDERARIQRKSRNELLEELRVKNRQLERYNEQLEVTVADRTAELRAANDRMRRDLDAGATYVRALIPPPMTEPIRIDWRYIPSSDLGGDIIGYHWLRDDLLALYLVDVTGHGLDSALLSVTVTNVIRAGSLPGVDMAQPGQVLEGLNEAFPAERHGDKFFTIWYGVYSTTTRALSWSGGGHHPSVLLTPGKREPTMLESFGPLVGAVSGLPYEQDVCDVAPGARLLISSDGVFEILRDGKLVWTLDGFNTFLAERAGASNGPLAEDVLAEAVRLRGSDQLEDDFSIIEAMFD